MRNDPEVRENPLGLDGFEFVEFTGPDPIALAKFFETLGFTHLATHRSKNVRRYAQGDVNFLLNMEPRGQVADFRATHGSSANAMAFRVHDAAVALGEAIRRGAKRVDGPVGPMELKIPAIEGIGGANLYLVDRYGAAEIYDVDFRPVAAEPTVAGSASCSSRAPRPPSSPVPASHPWADGIRQLRWSDAAAQPLSQNRSVGPRCPWRRDPTPCPPHPPRPAPESSRLGLGAKGTVVPKARLLQRIVHPQ